MAAPFVYLRPTVEDDGTGEKALMKAAHDGNLGRLKRIVKRLTKRNGDLSALFSINTNGCNVLHLAACAGHLEVCRYLVEELGGDVNAPGVGDTALGATPFMVSAQSGDVATVKYFLDHGGDLVKADDKGRTVLHHAAGIGCCKVTEFLLSKGVPVDIDCGRGTPLFWAANNEQDKTVKILLEHHANPNIIINGTTSPLMSALVYRSLKCMKLLIKAGADVNCNGSMLTPLLLATMHGGYTNFIKLLLKAGPDPNIPDDEQRHLQRRKALIKSKADTAFKQKEYKIATKIYDLAIAHGESATLYANRSVCKLLIGDGEGALSDALMCECCDLIGQKLATVKLQLTCYSRSMNKPVMLSWTHTI
ncbi:hypothetical protein VPH35_058699 [Triticum aestivum]|uniref:Uncharacterized protein n=3 Tax=Triticinae TaxID=1648030 RepID=A0A453EAP5_AEGTS